MALDTASDRHRDLTGWNIAAALGLLAAAFLVERLVPAKNEDASGAEDKARYLGRRTDRERRPRPACGVAFRDTREGMEGHPVARVLRTSGTIAFSPSPPA